MARQFGSFGLALVASLSAFTPLVGTTAHAQSARANRPSQAQSNTAALNYHQPLEDTPVNAETASDISADNWFRQARMSHTYDRLCEVFSGGSVAILHRTAEDYNDAPQQLPPQLAGVRGYTNGSFLGYGMTYYVIGNLTNPREQAYPEGRAVMVVPDDATAYGNDDSCTQNVRNFAQKSAQTGRFDLPAVGDFENSSDFLPSAYIIPDPYDVSSPPLVYGIAYQDRASTELSLWIGLVLRGNTANTALRQLIVSTHPNFSGAPADDAVFGDMPIFGATRTAFEAEANKLGLSAQGNGHCIYQAGGPCQAINQHFTNARANTGFNNVNARFFGASLWDVSFELQNQAAADRYGNAFTEQFGAPSLSTENGCTRARWRARGALLDLKSCGNQRQITMTNMEVVMRLSILQMAYQFSTDQIAEFESALNRTSSSVDVDAIVVRANSAADQRANERRNERARLRRLTTVQHITRHKADFDRDFGLNQLP